MNIGYIGNFEAKYSTENDRRWTFQKLGHNVYAFQENHTTKELLLEYRDKLDVLFYSHTHGWEIDGLIEVFKEYKQVGVPTVSVHLDRWVGLDRVVDVGKEATWHTEYIFMADGSPEAVELYEKHGLNWYYLRAAVVERDCYMAHPDPVNFPHEIVFVGSYGYHKEYPFRKKLIDALKKRYGDRFGHYGNGGIRNLRGHDLNVCYASSKIVVGDSCFGGRPNYVSDRYYETRGRGGFLLHPRVEGVDNVGIGYYEEENLESLFDTIEFYLKDEVLRKEMRVEGFEYVSQFGTYTNRAIELLDIISQ